MKRYFVFKKKILDEEDPTVEPSEEENIDREITVEEEPIKDEVDENKDLQFQMLQEIRNRIQEEQDAITSYENNIRAIPRGVYDEVANILESIKQEEKVHLGELHHCLTIIDPTEDEQFEKGVNENPEEGLSEEKEEESKENTQEEK